MTGIMKQSKQCENCKFWKNTKTESSCSAPYRCRETGMVLTSKDGKYSVGYTYNENGDLVDEWETLFDGGW